MLKQHELNWLTTQTDKLATLASQLFKTIQKE